MNDPLTKEAVDAMSVSTGNWGPGAFERLRSEWYLAQVLKEAVQIMVQQIDTDTGQIKVEVDLFDVAGIQVALAAFEPQEEEE